MEFLIYPVRPVSFCVWFLIRLWAASLQDVEAQQGAVFLAPAGSDQVLYIGEGSSVCAHVNQ